MDSFYGCLVVNPSQEYDPTSNCSIQYKSYLTKYIGLKKTPDNISMCIIDEEKDNTDAYECNVDEYYCRSIDNGNKCLDTTKI